MNTTDGLATSSTPMDRRLRCSTLSPEPPAQAGPAPAPRLLPPCPALAPTHAALPSGRRLRAGGHTPPSHVYQAPRCWRAQRDTPACPTWLPHDAVLDAGHVDHLQSIIHNLGHLVHANVLREAQARRKQEGLAHRGARAVHVLLLHVAAHVSRGGEARDNRAWAEHAWRLRSAAGPQGVLGVPTHTSSAGKWRRLPQPSHPHTRDQGPCSLGCPFTRMSPLHANHRQRDQCQTARRSDSRRI